MILERFFDSNPIHINTKVNIAQFLRGLAKAGEPNLVYGSLSRIISSKVYSLIRVLQTEHYLKGVSLC